uniref:Uncharacterized protein n=1 Tax=Terrapene triunguis TaxID=2587831 RepID=A0A674IZC7_9SAUR
MQMQSEGTRESDIKMAEGRKQVQILAAEKAEQIKNPAGHLPWGYALLPSPIRVSSPSFGSYFYLDLIM